MKDTASAASTFASVGGGVLIFGLALMLGSGGSFLLEMFGWLAAGTGLAAIIVGIVLRFGPAKRER